MVCAPAASPTACRWAANSNTWTAGRCRMRSGRAARCLEGRDWGFGNRDLERRGYHPQSPIPNPQSRLFNDHHLPQDHPPRDPGRHRLRRRRHHRVPRYRPAGAGARVVRAEDRRGDAQRPAVGTGRNRRAARAGGRALREGAVVRRGWLPHRHELQRARRADGVPDPPAPAGRCAAGALRYAGLAHGSSRPAVVVLVLLWERLQPRALWIGATRGLPPTPPRPGHRPRHHVHALADRPQVDHVRGDAREAVVVATDAAVLVAVDAAGEADFAVLLEHRRIVEAGAAGDEAAAGVVRGPVRAAVGVEAGGDHLEAGAVFLRLDLDDAPAPAHQGTGAVQLDGFARGDLVELALQRRRHGAAGGEQYAGEAGGGERSEVHADLSGTWSEAARIRDGVCAVPGPVRPVRAAPVYARHRERNANRRNAR